MSRRAVRVQPAARADLRDIAAWLRQEADAQTAARVIQAARRTFDKLARMPGLGAPAEAKSAALSNARRWHVERLPNYLIFYAVDPRGVVILRVLHAAQDWRRR